MPIPPPDSPKGHACLSRPLSTEQALVNWWLDGQSKRQTLDGKGFSTFGDIDIWGWTVLWEAPGTVGGLAAVSQPPRVLTRNLAKHCSVSGRDKSLTEDPKVSSGRRHEAQQSVRQRLRASVGAGPVHTVARGQAWPGRTDGSDQDIPPPSQHSSHGAHSQGETQET